MITSTGKQPRDFYLERTGGLLQITLNFCVKRMKTDENNALAWNYRTVKLPPGTIDRHAIISAVINEVYPQDRMQAITNNYLLGDEVEEFNEMQRFRVYAKEYATKVMTEYENIKNVDVYIAFCNNFKNNI